MCARLSSRDVLAQHGLDELRAVSDAGEARQTFEHEWERPYLEGSRDIIFRNTFADIERILERSARQGTRFEFECYDVGHLYNLAHMVDRGSSSRRSSCSQSSASSAASAPDVENLLHMRATADRLFGDDFEWSVLGRGAPPDADRHDGAL